MYAFFRSLLLRVSRVRRLLGALLLSLGVAIALAPTPAAAEEGEPDPLFGAEPHEIVQAGGLAYAVGQSLKRGPTLFVTDGTPGGTRALATVPCKGWESGGRRLGVIGDRPVVICQTPRPALWSVGLDGSLTPLHREFTESREYLNLQFAGGRAIAMSGSRLGGPRQLHLLEHDQVVLTDVPVVGLGDLFGALPDGSLVATTTTVPPYSSTHELRRFYPDGRTVVLGSTAGYNAEPDVTVRGSHIYFFGQDAEHGIEPWISDGTPEGTRLAVDASPGKASSSSGGRTLVAPDGTWYVETQRGARDTVEGALGPVVRIAPSGEASTVVGPDDGTGGRRIIERIEGLARGRVVFSTSGSLRPSRGGLFSAPLETTDAELVRWSYRPPGDTSFDGDDSWQRRVSFSRGMIGVSFAERLEFTDGTPGGTRQIGQLPGTWYRSDRTTSPMVSPVEVGGRLVFGALSPDSRKLELWATNADVTGIEPLTRSGQFGTIRPAVPFTLKSLGGRRYRVTGSIDFGPHGFEPRSRCRGTATAVVLRAPLGYVVGTRTVASAKTRVRWKDGACRFAVTLVRPARKPGSERRTWFVSVKTPGRGHVLPSSGEQISIGNR